MTLTLAAALTLPPLLFSCVLDNVRVALLPPVVAVLEVKKVAAPSPLLLPSLCLPAC